MNKIEILKQKILDKAIRGQLVKQNENDTPASELLKQIGKEKQELIKQGKLKKQKELSEITNKDIPFEIPKNWTWVRLGDLYEITSSKRVHKKDWKDNGIPFYRAREIVSLSKGELFKSPIYISESHYNQLKEMSGVPSEDDILITGVGTVGVPYVVDNKTFYFKDGNLVWLKNHYNLFSNYIYNIFNSNYIKNIIHRSSGTTVKTFTIVKAKNLLIPLPPPEEQERIVNKIEGLFSVIDAIDETAVDLNEKIEVLKQKILDKAIRGQLVEQDENDQPASELLKQIKQEKQELIKQGKIKKQKELPKITQEEISFEIPKTWIFERLGNVVMLNNLPKTESGKLPYLEVKYLRKTKEPVKKNNGCLVEAGTDAILVDGENSGEIFKITEKGYLGSTLKQLIFSKKIFKEYALMFINKNHFKLKGNKTGAAIPHLDKKLFKNLLLPLPPLEEQKRIVAKVEELFSQLDAIKQIINS